MRGGAWRNIDEMGGGGHTITLTAEAISRWRLVVPRLEFTAEPNRKKKIFS